MSDQFVAEIRIFGCNFAPTGWALCNGQILPISQNTALFSLLGTTYGGDGKSTFALPNLQARFPMHPGQGPGLSLRDLGESSGQDFVTLIASEMPQHTHAFAGGTGTPVQSPSAGAPGLSAPRGYHGGPANDVSNVVQPNGGNQPHNNLPPFLALNFCIALQGIFPPRS